ADVVAALVEFSRVIFCSIGYTSSTDFPTTSGAFQTTSGGGIDAFVAKIANIVLPPGATSGKVTGGGSIDLSSGDFATFGFIAQEIGRASCRESTTGGMQT